MERPHFSPLEAGRFFVLPEGIPARVLYDVPPQGWISWIGAAKPELKAGALHRFVMLTIVNATNVVVDGCTAQLALTPPVGPTVNDLVAALAALPPFVVTTQPSDVIVDGYHGKHLAISVPELPFEIDGDDGTFTSCTGGELMSWIGAPVDPAFYGHVEPGGIEELWVLDIDGRRLVIQTSWSPLSPEADVAELATMFASIDIEPLLTP